MKAVLLLDENDTVPAWQWAALELALADGLEIFAVANCVQPKTPTRPRPRYWGYYGLAAASRIGRRYLRQKDLSPVLAEVPRIRFAPQQEGKWQRIPREVGSRFQGADFVIKFGMGLLRDPQEIPVRNGVLSYHHGDPESFRGRPASFYEILNEAPVQGVIVQEIGNTLDGGRVLARAFSKVVPTSYSRTQGRAYSSGIPLLREAIRNLETGTEIEIDALGKNYTLPSNGVVGRFLAKTLANRTRRWVYGASTEKRWQTAHCSQSLRPTGRNTLALGQVQPVAQPRDVVFVADPFSDGVGGLYCEGLDRKTGIGRILHWSKRSGWEGVKTPPELNLTHLSYPQVVVDKDQNRWLFPEMSASHCPRLLLLDSAGTACVDSKPLSGLESIRLVDGTLFHRDSRYYLFGGCSNKSSEELRLWTSGDLFGPFVEHPRSPIVSDPRGARMAGGLATIEGRLLRFGQDNSGSYGDGVKIFEVSVIDQERYRETVVGSVDVAGASGPHSISLNDSGFLFDFYSEVKSPMAGLRRARAVLATKIK